MTIARKIRNYMIETGRTQSYLCKHTGLHPSAMSALLSGRRRMRLDEYCIICNALGVMPGTFLDGGAGL